MCNWYEKMIKKALEDNMVVDCIDFYDHFFVSKVERNVKITAAHLPCFDGAYWSGAAEDLIKKFEKGSGGRYGKMITHQFSRRVLKSMGQNQWDILNFQTMKERM